MLHGEQASLSMHGGGGGRRVFSSSNGRMEGPFGLDDRMRYADRYKYVVAFASRVPT